MFLGKTTLTLDSKGRIAIPARYREQLLDLCDGKLVISYNPHDNCLPIFPFGEWQECERKMEAVEDESADFRRFQRLIYSYTNDVDMDSSGRVLIPQASREEVGLTKNAVLIGHGKKFELWGEDNWLRSSKEDKEKLVESLKSRTERLHIGFRL
ncbi:division/cell wall cluster transcriptional repressor MraZ [Chromatiales bacterium (ex Bugula neritina AB1)]|nr:division/cell wall cluster transcriptional repressor MraZ [Chromatiales bacterium (ex Bugula neritina AB1)]